MKIVNQSILIAKNQEFRERSGYIIFSNYCSQIIPESGEISKIVGKNIGKERSIFHLSDTVVERLGTFLGIDIEAWRYALGRDLTGLTIARSVLLSELRYCRSCLQQGLHSALFQHPAAGLCPVHRDALRRGCPHCGKPVGTSVAAIAQNHMHCGACGKRLVTDNRSSSDFVENEPSFRNNFAALRMAISAAHPPGIIHSREDRWDVTPDVASMSASESNLVAFHKAWPLRPLPGLRSYDESRQTFGPNVQNLSQMDVNFRSRSSALAAFVKLAAVLRKHGCMDSPPMELLWGTAGAGRIDCSLSLVAAAFWRTAATFRVAPYVNGALPPPVPSLPQFGTGLVRTASAVEAIVTCQVYSLMAWNIVDLRRTKHAVQVSWNCSIRNVVFLPAWTATVKFDRLELRLRWRVSLKSINRLVQRYSKYQLTKVPVHLNLLNIVSGIDSI